MNCTILLGEVNSEKIDKEWVLEFNNFLQNVITYLNRVFKKSLKVKVALRKEEFQGVFNNALTAYLYYRQMKMLLYPLEIKAGLGEGKYYQNTETDVVEGPAHFNAHKALSLTQDFKISIAYISFNKFDKYLNSIFQAIEFLEKKNTISSNLIKLMAEFYFPLYKKNAMDFYEFTKEKNLLKALKSKENFYNLLAEEDHSIRGIYPDSDKFQLPKLEDCELIDLETLFGKEKADVVTCFWKRGFYSRIAKSLNNTTRQNVNKHLESGIILQRNLEGSVCLFLAEKRNQVN